MLGDKTIETEFAVMEGYYGNELEYDNKKIKLPENGLYISDVYLKEGVKKGKGYGQDIYIKALKMFGTLYSTYPTSPDAVRVQNKLVDKGIATVSLEYFDNIMFRVIKLNTN